MSIVHLDESQMIDHAYRSIEGYFGDEMETVLEMTSDEAHAEIIKWFKEENILARIPHKWEFDIAFDRYQNFVQEKAL